MREAQVTGTMLTAHIPKDGCGVKTLGPFPLPRGTINADQKKTIFEQTGVTVINRGNAKKTWEPRSLSLKGPSDQVDAALEMAIQCIEHNGVDGGRADPAAQDRLLQAAQDARAERLAQVGAVEHAQEQSPRQAAFEGEFFPISLNGF